MSNILKLLTIFASLSLMSSAASAETYGAGQIWSYKTRSTETASVATILQIDEFNDSRIIHISLNNLVFDIEGAPDGFTQVDHVPIAEEAFTGSVLELLGTADELPNFQPGYKTWKDAFDKGEAGVFSVSIAECVAFMEEAIRGGGWAAE